MQCTKSDKGDTLPQVQLSRPEDEVQGEQDRLEMNIEIGPVEARLIRAVEAQGAAHLTLIDPDSQDPLKAALVAEAAAAGGTDALMVGGSVGAAGLLLYETVEKIKRKTDLPVILFPGGTTGLSENADAVFFMSLLNSRSTAFIAENQALGAPLVLRYGLEPIPMAYLIVEPGGTVGWVGDARLIPRRKPELAVAYALAARFMGMRLVYLEAGSGADSPVPKEMVAAVKRIMGGGLLIVGGGIRSGAAAAELVAAGADLIVTGTAVERSRDVTSFVRELTDSIHRRR
ncbi:MAG: Geranylgeranylglyceryl phosphate synthase [Methanosaeta sp. PtaU1.Bin060]|jgi:phosphoglycerol geranylgeranyltransferase|nr:MAG: Geranylgeranylglyceryl phosphate synthase [Methanosaeta sp. PtaU1.Bin060]